MEANARELRAIEYIGALDARLTLNEKYLEPRLRSVPDLYRQYRIAKVATEKVIDGLYSTMDQKSLLYLRRVCENSELIFRPKSVLNDATDTQVVLTKDLLTLVGAVADSCCSLCIRTGREIKNCQIRKALMNIAPLNNITDSALCEYTDASKDFIMEDG